MAYLSVKNSNDYRSGNLVSQEIAPIINLYREYENEHSNSEYIKDADLPNVFKFLWGSHMNNLNIRTLRGRYRTFAEIIIY